MRGDYKTLFVRQTSLNWSIPPSLVQRADQVIK